MIKLDTKPYKEKKPNDINKMVNQLNNYKKKSWH